MSCSVWPGNAYLPESSDVDQNAKTTSSCSLIMLQVHIKYKISSRSALILRLFQDQTGVFQFKKKKKYICSNSQTINKMINELVAFIKISWFQLTFN